MIRKLIIFSILLLLLTAPALASTIHAEDVGSYSITADPGNVFYKIKVGDLPIGTNQTHTFMYQGYPYLLSVNTWTSYGVIKNAEISLTLPNGSTQTSTTSATTVVGSYSTVIQPTVRSDSSVLESGTVTFLTVDLNIGLVPVKAQFSTAPLGYNPETSIPFTSASGSFSNSQITDVYVYQVTTKEFQDTIVNYDPSAGLNDLGSAVFQWTWASVMGFINMIPVIGPIAVSFFTMAGGIIGELWFWSQFLYINLPAILLALESLIIMMSVINAGSGKGAMGKMASNIYHYNIAVALGIITTFTFMRDWIGWAINVVASIVQSLKPL
jgi:hypothetical protein